MVLVSGLRYGENPHQGAAFYVDRSLAEAGKGGVASAVQHHGKEMSYNNYLDADAAYGCACDYTGQFLVALADGQGIGLNHYFLRGWRLRSRCHPLGAITRSCSPRSLLEEVHGAIS